MRNLSVQVEQLFIVPIWLGLTICLFTEEYGAAHELCQPGSVSEKLAAIYDSHSLDAQRFAVHLNDGRARFRRVRSKICCDVTYVGMSHENPRLNWFAWTASLHKKQGTPHWIVPHEVIIIQKEVVSSLI